MSAELSTARGRRWAGRQARQCVRVAVLAGALAALLPAGAQAQWLVDLHRRALALDPAVQGADAQWRAADERVVQARAGFGPTASASYGQSATRYREEPDNTLRQFSATQYGLQVTQPLIRTVLVPTLEGAEAQREQARRALDQARTDAGLRLVEAVFDVLKSRDALAQADAQRLAADEQLASARRSFQVGRATLVDLRDAEGRIATVNAQRAAAAADLLMRRGLLEDLVGGPVPAALAQDLAGDALPALPDDGLADWLAVALAGNAQLQAAEQALAAAEADVRKAWQGHAPTLDLTYNHQFNDDTGTVTTSQPRRGTTSQIGLTLNVPLFAGGATQSRVREAMAVRDKARSDVDAARRNVQMSVRQSFANALGSAGLARGLTTATQALDVAWQANRRGYEVGVKVISDVLEAQTKVFDSRRELSRARFDAWLYHTRLQGLAGRLDDAAVARLDALLVALPAPQPQPVGPARGAP